MQRFLVRLLVSALAVLLASRLIPSIQVTDLQSALLFAFVLGLLNAFVRPILLVLALPLTVLTLGLFTLVINALVFWLASRFPVGVDVRDTSGAFFGALTVSIASFVASRAFR